jgi:hypothetical protein
MTTTDRACLTDRERRALRTARQVSGLVRINVDRYQCVIVAELSLQHTPTLLQDGQSRVQETMMKQFAFNGGK